MEYFPVFFDIKNRPCLLVGGGDVASRKAKLLLAAGASLKVVAPEICDSLRNRTDDGDINFIERDYESTDIDGVDLIIAATNNRQVNEQISKDARALQLPVNVVDSPELCSFIVPSIIDRSPVMVAVSSGGSSPVLARLLRARLESLIPSSYGRLATLLKSYRDKVKQRFSQESQRRKFWEKMLQGSLTELMFSGQEDSARKLLEEAIEKGDAHVSSQGEVYLIGAGPGDPDLLTFRALRLLQQADVVVYDRLVSKPILELSRKDADYIYVGKQKADHALPQEQINELLVSLAKEGKRVVRLKGGDPFIFGRGGEEIDTLMENDINFQVVPGITAASGCSAYSGIPLTHRDYAQSVVFATGHLKNGTIDLDWKALVQKGQTIVFYMGLTGLNVICEKLVENGMSKETPLALIEKGTRHDQKVHIGTLATMPELAKGKEIHPPTLIIVGDVVKLHEKLSWFMKKEQA